MNTLKLIEALLFTVENFMLAAQRIKALFQQAHAEGRDISDAELAAFRAENESLLRGLEDRLP